MSFIFQTEPSLSFLVLRLGLAFTFFAHSGQQIFGWFGGRGVKDTVNNWKARYGIPPWLAGVGMFIEFAGSFALLMGYLTRPFALGLAIFMFVAMQKAHLQHGFFLGRQGAGNGIEFCLALFLMAVALFIGGGGALSIDGLLAR
jgi:putative oxidoreductase